MCHKLKKLFFTCTLHNRIIFVFDSSHQHQDKYLISSMNIESLKNNGEEQLVYFLFQIIVTFEINHIVLVQPSCQKSFQFAYVVDTV